MWIFYGSSPRRRRAALAGWLFGLSIFLGA
jgi:hypothetical protein